MLDLLAGFPWRSLVVRATLDGRDEQSLTLAGDYRYYKDPSAQISRIHPQGGPLAGGTKLHVYLSDDRLLLDLGGELHGPHCRFQYLAASPSGHRVDLHTTVIEAELTTCGGSRSCGAGWGSMACAVPAYNGPLNTNGAADVTVEVTINGQDYTQSGRTFRYYDPLSWRLLSFEPLGGPVTGNTSMVISTALLESLGDVRCRFGDHPLTTETNATLDGSSQLRCTSPAHWEQHGGKQHVELMVTLNGQDYLRAGPQARAFTYYDVDNTVFGLSVQRLTPSGGPSAGGTAVQVMGTGFVDLGGLLCFFKDQPPVPATLISDTILSCLSPGTQLTSSFAPQAVEVTINGQHHARTSSSGAQFRYYSDTDLRISSIFPRGGPAAGGTLVTVRGVGFVDLDHGNGLKCAFLGPLVPATAAEGSSESLTCVTPPATTHAYAAPDAYNPESAVAVRLTLNGNNSAMADVSAMTSEDGAPRFYYHEMYDGTCTAL